MIETTAKPVPAASSRYVADMLGMDDDATACADAVERGNVVLTVRLADAQRVDELSAILENSGALEVEERVEPWQAGSMAPGAIGHSTDHSIEDLPYGSLAPEGHARRPAAQRYAAATPRVPRGPVHVGLRGRRARAYAAPGWRVAGFARGLPAGRRAQ